MNEEFLANLSLKSVLLSVYRQRMNAALFLVTLVGVVFIALMLIPKKYESEGKLFVRLGRGGVTLDPTATTGQTIDIQESRESEINSIVDILKSRGILEKVLQHPEITTDRVLESNSLLSKISLPSIGSKKDEDDIRYDKLKAKDLAIIKLFESIDVGVPRKAATVSIWCKTESPEFSQLIVDTLMEKYIEEHVFARRTDGSFDFFEKQFNEQKAVLDEATNRLSEYKTKIGVMSIEARRKSLRERISLIETRLINAGSNLAAAKTRLETSTDLLTTIPEELTLEEISGEGKQGTELMRDRLYDLQIQEKQLLARYTPEHPAVKAVQAQVIEAKQIMSGEAPEQTITKKGVNENLQAFKLNIMNDRVEASAVTSEQDSLERKLMIANREMVKLNHDEIKLGDLMRSVQVAERNFKIYAEKMEEARINLELDKKQISNVKIIQPASLQVKHVSPRKGLILILTTMFACCGAVLFAIFLDRLTGTLNAPEDIVNVLKMDLLATVPTDDRNNEVRRLRRIRKAVAATAESDE